MWSFLGLDFDSTATLLFTQSIQRNVRIQNKDEKNQFQIQQNKHNANGQCIGVCMHSLQH